MTADSNFRMLIIWRKEAMEWQGPVCCHAPKKQESILLNLFDLRFLIYYFHFQHSIQYSNTLFSNQMLTGIIAQSIDQFTTNIKHRPHVWGW